VSLMIVDLVALSSRKISSQSPFLDVLLDGLRNSYSSNSSNTGRNKQ
jgi:hypothetical protein